MNLNQLRTIEDLDEVDDPIKTARASRLCEGAKELWDEQSDLELDRELTEIISS